MPPERRATICAISLIKDATGFELKAWPSAGSTHYSVSLLRNGKDSGSAYCSDKR